MTLAGLIAFLPDTPWAGIIDSLETDSLPVIEAREAADAFSDTVADTLANPSKPSEPPPLQGCPAQIDSILSLYSQGDPGFLLVSILDADCRPEEKHEAYYRQALGYLILGMPEEAKLHLQTCLFFPGPYRESAWYELWKVAKTRGDKMTMGKAIQGMHREFSESPRLWEMLQPVVEADRSRRIHRFGTQHSFVSAHDPSYARDYAENRLTWSAHARVGKHGFNPSLQFGSIHDLDGDRPWRRMPRLSSYAGLAALGYFRGWFFANGTLGFSYDYLRETYSGLAGTTLSQSLQGWNAPQAGLALGSRIPLAGDKAGLMLFGTANRFHESFQHLSANASAYARAGDWQNTLSASLERMFFDTPLALPFEDSVFRLSKPLAASQVSQTLGLNAWEGAYALGFGRGKWRASLTLAYRSESERLREAVEPLVFIAVNDSSRRDTLFYADTAVTENSATASWEMAYAWNKSLSLRGTARYGHMWVTSRALSRREDGPIYRAYLGITTSF